MSDYVGAWRPRQIARQILLRCAPRKRIISSHPSSHSIYLTFDDGPHPEYTPRVLDVLHRLSIKSTFFVVGKHCEQHPQIVQRIIDEGHTIGSHTYFHTDLSQVTSKIARAEIARTDATLTQILGFGASLFRPPYGRLSLSTLLALWKLKKTIVLWNADPRDYSASSSGQLLQWFKEHPLSGGDIVLLHDSHAHAANILPEVVYEARERGLCFLSLASGPPGIITNIS